MLTASKTLALANFGETMAQLKTQVVSVRVEPQIKAALQAAADKERRSLANMIEVMVMTYCQGAGVVVEDTGSQDSSSEKASTNS